MKKFLITISCLLLCVVLAGCSATSSSATITSLCNQLDSTSNCISNLETINPSDLSLSSLNTTQTNSININNLEYTQQSIMNEEYYKISILNKIAKIKNCISNESKLSKTQISAIKELTNGLSRYTNSINYSQKDFEDEIKSIKSLKKNYNKNIEKINAKIGSVCCYSNARTSYYENILNILEQLEETLPTKNCLNDDSDNNKLLNSNEDKTLESSLFRNIDTYQTTDKTTGSNCEDFDNNTVEKHSDAYTKYYQQPNIRNIDTYAPQTRNIDSFGFNRMNGFGGFNGFYGNGMGYGYNNGYLGYYPNNFYNNGIYGYNSNNINRINTNQPVAQNTRFTTAPVTESPKERLEDFEIVNKDNTIEKLTDDKIDEAENIETTSLSESKSLKETDDMVRIKDVRHNKKQRNPEDDAPIIAY